MSTRFGQVEAVNERLRAAFPELAPMFEALGYVEAPQPSDEALCDAVVRIVAGQMLSSRAAQAITQRLEAEAEAEALGCGLVGLPPERLAACGLSARKVRKITEFGLVHRSSPERFAGWGELAYENLRGEVRAFWGGVRLNSRDAGHLPLRPSRRLSLGRRKHRPSICLGDRAPRADL